MVASTWPLALDFVWRPENDGEDTHTDPGDTGGWTRWGVTHDDWTDAVEHGVVGGSFANASKPDLATVLRRAWDALRCDELKPGVDLAVFNFAMVSTAGHAVRVLQWALGVAQDGVFGPVTMAAAARVPAAALIADFTADEDRYYKELGDFWRFGRGWLRRADDCQELALQIARGQTT